MKGYEFYYRDPIKGLHQIGTLRERRKNPARITQETVLNWGRTVLGKNISVDDIFFVEITIDEGTRRSLEPDPSCSPLKDL